MTDGLRSWERRAAALKSATTSWREAVMTERARLPSLDPLKLGETDLRRVTEAMHALMREGDRYPRKMGRRDAIRRKCIDCSGGKIAEVRRCEAINCSLWPYRLGSNPYRERVND